MASEAKPGVLLDRYFAAKSGVSAYEQDVFDWLEPIGKRYLELQADLREAEGKERYWSGDRWPVTVTNIDDCGDYLRVEGHWTRRGCTDEEWCQIPSSLAYASDEEREAIFAELERRIAAAKGETHARKSAEERAEYERLKAKYEGEGHSRADAAAIAEANCSYSDAQRAESASA